MDAALPRDDAAARPLGPVRRRLRTLRLAYWLGWQIESNWTDPIRFLAFALARPLGGALILYFMYRVVAGPAHGGVLAFLIVGAAFWPLVVAGMMGLALGVIADREHYRMLRAVYTAPISWPAYLIGRSLAQATSAVAAAGLTLVLGVVALGVSLDAGAPLALIAALALGVVAIVAMGFLVVGLALTISGEAWRMPEAVGAALYLVCGVIVPIPVLPGFLQPLSAALPLTWWLEAVRRALLPATATVSFPAMSDAAVLGRLALLTAAWVAGVAVVFRLAERRARNLGVLDQESQF